MVTVRSLVRRVVRRGPRTVVLLQEWAGFGNQLYYLLHVYRRQRAGENIKAVRSRASEPWLTHFAHMRDQLTIAPEEFHWSDRIDPTDWDSLGRFGVDYSREELQSFLTTFIVPSLARTEAERVTPSLTVNVRRGDYYWNPPVRGKFSIDQPQYLSVALERYTSIRPHPEHILVVSDDQDWCEARLGFLKDYTHNLRFARDSAGPLDDFTRVCRSQDLIITNSTFSMWAAHVSSLLNDGTSLVIAPAFITRPHRGRCEQLDPRWSIIEDLPGGWDS